MALPIHSRKRRSLTTGIPYSVARLSLLEGRPSSSSGHPSSPTMSTCVRFVTAGLGVPPRCRTTSNASARLMHASRPVKATEDLSAKPSSSTDVIIYYPDHFSLARFLAGRRAWVLGAGAFFFSASILDPQRVHEIDHLRRQILLRRFDLFPGLFLFEQINQRTLISVLELRRIEMACLGLDDMRCEIEHLFGKLQIGNVFEIGLFVANFVGPNSPR